MEKDMNKRTKEDFAKQIARNMAKKHGESEIANNDNIFLSNDSIDNEKTTVMPSLNFSHSFSDTSNNKNGNDNQYSRRNSGMTSNYSHNEQKAYRQNNSSDFRTANSPEKRNRTSSKKRDKKFKVTVTVMVSIIVLIVSAFTGIYFYGLKQSKNKFLTNTTINGIAVGGKTEEEVYDLIVEKSVIPEKILLIKADGTDLSIPLSKIGYKDNIKTTISQYFSQQNNYLWFKNLFSVAEYNFNSTFTYDNNILKSEVKRKLLDSPGTVEPKDAYIKKGDSGFVIVDEVKGDKVDEDKLDSVYKHIDEYLADGEYTIDLAGIDCYKKPKVTASELAPQLDKLNSLYDIEIKFDFTYTTETLSGSDILDWIEFDKGDVTKGFSVDADKAMDYVEDLAEKYDTFGKDRKFKSTSRGWITVPAGKGCYGWWIDQQKTCDQLVELIEKGESADVKPIYYRNPDSYYHYVCDESVRTAESDMGDTYCEIDLAKQHFWYYEKGKLKYESDIVSGLPTKERNTPGGVYKLWIKEKNKTLQGSLPSGEKWSTPVTYWNNISTFGVGLHDGTWQAYFGGERYKTYGSHGCINMPYKAAEYVYNNVPMGTPVVMYW